MISYNTEFFNTYSQSTYDHEVDTLDLSLTRCSCGAVGSFVYHSDYKRHVIIDDTTDAILLTIHRMKCMSCNRTHAILPIFIIPYRIFSMPIINKIIDLYRTQNLSETKISRMLDLPVTYIQHLINYYKKHHLQRLLALMSRCKEKIGLPVFIREFHNENSIFFMQRVTTTNHLISNNVCSP